MSLRSAIGNLFKKTPPYIIDMQGTSAIAQDGTQHTIAEQIAAPPMRENSMKAREAAKAYTFSPEVFSAVKLKANLVSTLPLKVYWTKAGGEKTERTSGPLYDLLHNPNPSRTIQQLIGDFLSWANLTGDAYIVLDEIMGEQYLFCLDSRYVIPILDKDNRYEGIAYTKHQAKYLYYPKEMVIHWQEFNPTDAWYGLPRIAPLADDIKARYAAIKNAKQTFERGGVDWAKLTIQRGLSEDEIADIKADWKRRKNDQSRLMVIEDGQDFEFLDKHMAEGDSTLATWKISRETIANVFGIPPSIFDPEKNQDWLDAERFMWDATLIPEATIIQTLFSLKLTPAITKRAGDTRYTIEFDTSGILAFTKQRVEEAKFYGVHLAAGTMTPNDVRAILDMPLYTGEYAEFGDSPNPVYMLKNGMKPAQGVQGGRDQSSTGEPQNPDTTGRR